MSRKLSLILAAAALGLGACSVHETITASTASDTRYLHDNRLSALEMEAGQGASSSTGGSGSVGGAPVQVWEKRGIGWPAERVQ